MIKFVVEPFSFIRKKQFSYIMLQQNWYCYRTKQWTGGVHEEICDTKAGHGTIRVGNHCYKCKSYLGAGNWILSNLMQIYIYTICQQCFRSVIIIHPAENEKVISILNIEKKIIFLGERKRLHITRFTRAR